MANSENDKTDNKIRGKCKAVYDIHGEVVTCELEEDHDGYHEYTFYWGNFN